MPSGIGHNPAASKTANYLMPFTARLAKWTLGLFGWRVVSEPPPQQKGVVIIYPHTSNWDFILGVLARAVLQLRMHWVGKHTLFRWPFEPLMRALGGVPVDRRNTKGLVEQLKKEFDRYDQFFITITPEGTRSRTEYWRSGFYHIALGLKLPLGLATFDYVNREVILKDWYMLTGDVEKDLAYFREVYKGRVGKRPELVGEIRFRE
jgi:1-acyl-sn-glycerol-3-phosphate acyltransferase